MCDTSYGLVCMYSSYGEQYMDIQVFAYEDDSYHSHLVDWKSALSMPSWWDHSNENVESSDFWDILHYLYTKNFFKVKVDVNLDIQSLTEDLAEQFRSTNRPSVINRYLGKSIREGRELEHCYLVHTQSGSRLDPSLTIAESDIQDGDILGLIFIYQPYQIPGQISCMISAPNPVDLFATIHSKDENPPNPQGYREISRTTRQHIWGALLYTDEDQELATYVRKHFTSLSHMSGKTLHIFVIEKPPSDWKITAKYWKEILQEKLFVIWSTMGWLDTKPYDKSQSYEIGRRLGVYPDQLPCLVLFDKVDSKDKLIFPIQSVSPRYLRRLFTELEKRLETEESSEVSYDSLKRQYQMLINTLEQKEEYTDRSGYILDNEWIVIINLEYKEAIMTENNVIINGDNTFQGDFVVAGSIENSLNKVVSSNKPEELKELLKDLVKATGEMSKRLPPEKQQEVAQALDTLSTEAVKEKPRREWWRVSSEGLAAAAKDIGEIGKPVLEILAKLTPLVDKVPG